MQVSVPESAVDPVCGMIVDVATARFVSVDGSVSDGDGKVYFCAAGCQQAWESRRGAR